MSNQQTLQTKFKAPGIFACPPYVLRTNKVVKMFQRQMSAMISNRADETVLFSISFDNEIFLERLQFQQAVFNRIFENQKSWFTGIAGIIQEYMGLKEANTLSKHVEQECNIIGQWSALITRQVASWTEMLENFQTDYDYWISQKR